jgi:predicted phosphodiesterase
LPGAVPTRIHRADLCGLAPKTTYYYQVGGGPAGKEVWSEVRAFTTAAAPDAAASVTIGVSGDSRDSLDVVWPLLQTRLAKAGVDLQLFSGDSIKGYSLDYAENDYAKWFDGAAQAGSLGATWIAAVGGNHENLNVQWLGNHALPGSGPDEALYSSFDVGPAHVVLLDDQIVATQEHLGFAPDTRKRVLDWLKADLAAADARRSSVPWIVVAHHRGPLSTSSHSDDADMKTARELLLPLFDAHHVDLVLNGHDHNYERSKPSKLGKDGPQPVASEAEGTVYVVCAGAGAEGYGKGGDPAPFRAMNWEYTGTSFVGVYGLLSIDGKTLSWKAMGLKATAGGPEVDEVVDEVSWSK